MGRSPAARIVDTLCISANLSALRPIDAVEADALAMDLDRIAIDDGGDTAKLRGIRSFGLSWTGP
jgi:hypothetical protein